MGRRQADAFDRAARFSAGPAGATVIFLWAAGEATVLPIIADFLLLPMAVVTGRRYTRPLAACIAGMTVGGIAGYLYALRFPNRYRRLVQGLPLTPDTKIAVVQERLQRHGVAVFLVQPYSGIPMKVWSAAAASIQIGPWRAIPLFVSARALRMALVALSAQFVGRRFRSVVRSQVLVLTVLYTSAFFSIWGRMIVSSRRSED